MFTWDCSNQTYRLKTMLALMLYSLTQFHFVPVSSTFSVNPCGGVRGRFICDDHDPQVFHICMGNQKYTNRCPGDLHYNVRTQTCDWPKAVNCVEEARLHASRTGQDSKNHESHDSISVADNTNNVEIKEHLETKEIGNTNRDMDDVPIQKRKFSFDHNPKVQNKFSSPEHDMDKYEEVQDVLMENVLTKAVDDNIKIDRKENISNYNTDAKNISINTTDSPKAAIEVTDKINEETFENTTPKTADEHNTTFGEDHDSAGHLIETYMATETPEAVLYTRPLPRQRARRPSLSPYKSPFVSTTKPQVATTKRSVTENPTTAATPRRPVSTSRSPFRKTTVVYHPFLTNRSKPDFREYAPEPTTKRPQDSRRSSSSGRSKWSPYISSAPYRSATNYNDDVSDSPKWYELEEEKKFIVTKPSINSNGPIIGKKYENDIDTEKGRNTKGSDEFTTTTFKSTTLWYETTADKEDEKRTKTASGAIENVRNLVKSRNFRERRPKTSTTQDLTTTALVESVRANVKKFKPKTPLSQAWINERKNHWEIDNENTWTKSIFKKNRWATDEKHRSTFETYEITTPDTTTTTTTKTTRTPTTKTTSRSHGSKKSSRTITKTSMYSTDARYMTTQPRNMPSINAAASQTEKALNEVSKDHEASTVTPSKLPWWSLASNKDSKVTPNHLHNSEESKRSPFYRRAYLPRHFLTHRPNYHTRTPSFDTDTSDDKTQEQNSPLYKPKDEAANDRSFDLHKVSSELDDDRRFSLHREYKPQMKSDASDDRTFALHKAKNSATNQYSAAAAVDKRPGLDSRGHAINAPASSDQIEELAKGIDDKKPSDNKSPIEKYEYKKGKCSSSWCKLPDCRCVGSDIPGELEAKDIPQMVMLTFDDSINSQNMGYYKKLFNGTLKNPNGCPIKATFFVSGDNSDYDMVKKMYKGGHEIASHTMSHRSPTTWWADAGFENWENEIVGMKKRLNEKSGVPLKEITGMRAPFLQVGGDSQYAMLKENKFRYDTSMVTGNLYVNNEPPTWPFTLDTPPDSKTCSLTPCPTRSYPGLWEVPLIRWYGSNKIACAMPDACTIGNGVKGSRKFIEDNFMRHYTTNRAPFGIFIHASWFGRKDGNIEGLLEFLASLADKSDVWVVTVSQSLDWIQKPVRMSAINAIESWKC